MQFLNMVPKLFKGENITFDRSSADYVSYNL